MPLFNRRSVVPEAAVPTAVEEPYYPPPPGPPPPLTDEEREHQAQFLADQERLLAAFDGQLPPTSDIYPPPPGPPPPLEECLYPENPEKYQKRSVTASLIRLSRPIVTFALLVLTCIGINEKFPHHPIVKHAKFVHKEAVGALNGEHSYKITVSKEAKENTYPYSYQDLAKESENKEEVEKETKEDQDELVAKFNNDNLGHVAKSDEAKAESKKSEKSKKKKSEKKKSEKKADVKSDSKKKDADSKKGKDEGKSADTKSADAKKKANSKKENKKAENDSKKKDDNKKADTKKDGKENKKKDKKRD